MTVRMTMGPVPAVAGCRCLICLPPGRDELDDEDRSVVDTVLRAGWQVIGVGADQDGPSFAYTIGLRHRTGHPEIAMTGQPVELMVRSLNYVAEHVLSGRKLRRGDTVEGVLAAAPVVVDRVSVPGKEYLGRWSRRFHRGPVDVYQLVWPTVFGVFAWQPGAPDELDERQPPRWRIESKRKGAVAADPVWPLPVPPDDLALVCTHVTRQIGTPIRFVARQDAAVNETEDWTFHCGKPHRTDELQLQHIAHVVRAAPSIRRVAELPLGRCAERDDAFGPWREVAG